MPRTIFDYILTKSMLPFSPRQPDTLTNGKRRQLIPFSHS